MDMADQPDFIVDPSGRAQDVRRQKYSQRAGSPPPRQPGYESSGNGKGRPTYGHSPQKPKRPTQVIVIPIGLIFTIILCVLGKFIDLPSTKVELPNSGRYSSDFDLGSSDYDLGNSYFYYGEYNMAIAQFNKAISSKPDHGLAYNNRGLAYYRLGETDKAIADLSKAIQLLPGSAMPYTNRGAVYLSEREYGNAIADLDIALELSPMLSKAYYNRGQAHLFLGNYRSAVADFDKAILYTPESIPSMAYQKPNDDSLPSSRIAEEIRLTQSYTDLPMTYANRGYAHLHRGDHTKALADLDKAIGLQPELALAYYYRGVAHCSIGRLSEGIADLEKVLELNNDPAVQQDAETYLKTIGAESH